MSILGTDLSSPAWEPPRVAAADAARARLAGTVWARSDLAQLLYRAFYGLGVVLGRAGVSANSLTYASLVFAALSGVAAALGFFAAAGLALIVGGLCDALDGVVARATNTVSAYGALLDSTIDRVTDTLPLLGILVFHAHYPLAAALPGLVLVGSVVIPYARARTEALGAKLPSLFMRRPERVVILILCLLLGGLHAPSGEPAALLLVGMGILAVLNAIGGIAVLRAAREALDPVTLAANARRTSRRP